MIYEIIYANRDRGYDLYDRSPGFPTEYLSEIRTVCGRLCGQGTPDNYARHFAFLPLTGNMCLFAVIIRQPRGNAGEKRAHSMVLNLVCSNEDAAFLLGRPAFLFSAMENAAENDLSSSGSVLPVYETPEDLLSLSGEIRRPSRIPAESLQKVLLMSLFYAGEGKPGQVMISLQEPSAAPECLCWLLPMVPEEVRPRLSFHTGIQTASEGIGCILKFCTEKDYALMQRTGFDGGERAVLSHWAGGRLTCNDRPVLDRASRLAPFLSEDTGSSTWSFLLERAGIEDESTSLRERGNEKMTTRSQKNGRPSAGALIAAILIEAVLCALLLGGLAAGFKYMLSVTLSQSGSYVIVQAEAVRKAVVGLVCLAAGFFLGILVSHIASGLKRLRGQ
ncbi:MAG: hypothetical protein II774_06980 [Lachnospiraceae bacterium]|nr:hypothetical protein [Lachnospiraceae bacterium]